MHIVYDYQIFALQRVGGISRYFVELARRLPACSPGIETTVLAPVHVNQYLASNPVHTIGWKVPCFPGKHRILPAINGIVSRTLLKLQHPDILHETYYSATAQSSHVPHILSVYDMIHERFPNRFQGPDLHIPQLKAKAVARADHVIAISKSTRADLIKYLHVSPEKITVIPLATSFEKPEKKKGAVVWQRPYLLYVGLRGGVKNFHTLLLAFAHSPLLSSEFDLLCVGGGAFTPEEVRTLQDSGVGWRIKHLDADDSQLAALYSQAALFVYPSLYEGFGLPLLEAMRCGCPVACSDTSSMPEIAGDAAIYFDPAAEEELRCAMESIVQSTELVTALRVRGYERAKLFSWDSCVSQTLELYRSKV
ncbi:MAG: glycosyltransferase family 4 protein [Proteobacteria bacterium]|nr:glycosyltransferase family 4 protein [Pseudomonadota bacterium]MBU1060624.1 glycosyltransferase family 4 protein [Pseudomonadota bacterium]